MPKDLQVDYSTHPGAWVRYMSRLRARLRSLPLHKRVLSAVVLDWASAANSIYLL